MGLLGAKAASIGEELLESYGSADNAERALVDALLKNAGVEGIRLHAGDGGKEQDKKSEKQG